ncbi:SRPBCC domain-containing protein [Photobacterium sanctipauli]|uniref:SRPBCC domain-containing protein n=1 Tax=Photobacterium sanctipauli TaxID=1342794 RepID=A0A2T3NYC0_9GAMM|nr:SRPBCC domain-containing protein [Photobacterium sanctipauli]PSW21250.1 SRPBCC domain-containing protein [Photobacterium sanctipauli]
MQGHKGIHWPDYYHPRHAQLHVSNELLIEVDAPPVWSLLVHAPYWPSWSNSKTSVQILNGDGVELTKGSLFRWKTTGMNFTCTVVEYVPNHRIAWRGKCGEVDMYHAWLIEPNDKGCRVITESTQRGGLTWLTRYFNTSRIASYHHKWLKQIQQQTCDT